MLRFLFLEAIPVDFGAGVLVRTWRQGNLDPNGSAWWGCSRRCCFFVVAFLFQAPPPRAPSLCGLCKRVYKLFCLIAITRDHTDFRTVHAQANGLFKGIGLLGVLATEVLAALCAQDLATCYFAENPAPQRTSMLLFV